MCVCSRRNKHKTEDRHRGREDQNTFIIDILCLFHKNLGGQKIKEKEWVKKAGKKDV